MRQLFCIWSGDNKMSDVRLRCLDSIIKNAKIPVYLITPDNINNFISPVFPLHEAYEYLSLTHKADYLRAYLMHVHGSGYTDIKQIYFDWNPYFEQLENEPSYLFNGYTEACSAHIASNIPMIQNAYKNLVGCGHFIFKANSIFTFTWLNRVHDVLDKKLNLLKQFPGHYHPRAVYGGIHGEDTEKYKNSQYPLEWNEILGKIIHPLMYEYIGKFLHSMPPPQLHSYR